MGQNHIEECGLIPGPGKASVIQIVMWSPSHICSRMAHGSVYKSGIAEFREA
jgi:hypothetical protein